MERVDWHPYRFAERIWLQKPAVDFPLTFSVDSFPGGVIQGSDSGFRSLRRQPFQTQCGIAKLPGQYVQLRHMPQFTLLQRGFYGRKMLYTTVDLRQILILNIQRSQCLLHFSVTQLSSDILECTCTGQKSAQRWSSISSEPSPSAIPASPCRLVIAST